MTAMWQRLLCRLFFSVVLVTLCSFILGLLDALTRSSATLSFYSLFAVFHLYLAPAATMLLSALAIAVALQGRRWSWALVLAAATAFFLVRPLLFVYYGHSPLAIQMQDWPLFWAAAVLYSLFYGAGAVVLVAIWRFVRSLDQQRGVDALPASA